ncbi:Uma2 family endonuclease [Pannus brasiliensis CCIBt3594]|uniref:Uma2 family endonuclease n=1 Tax=Pannus brasiliensis CCIBt3594 TaxID=1427578 RepID=A0AAW9QVI5_9CHRO
MVAVNSIEQKLTLEDFLNLPETKPASEYIDGEIRQKPMPQGEHSTLQGELVTGINQVAKPQKIAYALPELRCTFGGRSIVPDIAVFTWERIPRTESGRIANKFETYPDWVIEILSPEQSANKVIEKILFCLRQGTRLAWLIDPEDESVLIFRLDRMPEIKREDDILPALPVLEDWRLSVREMFAWLTP